MSATSNQSPPDWYPDPTGRFEMRYFNGRAWTSDVSTDGTRYVDAAGVHMPPHAGSGSDQYAQHPYGGPPQRNAFAVAALVLGIVGVGIAWMPFVFVAGVAASIMAVVFGVIGLRRSRTRNTGRPFAITGIITGTAGIAVGIVGLAFTGAVLDAYDDYNNPLPHTVSIERCQLADGIVGIDTVIMNDGDATTDFSVAIRVVRPGTDNVQRVATGKARDVAPGESATIESTVRTTLDAVECQIDRVYGPLPFGIEP